LMALLFVTGVMNVIWIAILTLLVCGEKMLPPRLRGNMVIGVLLAIWGAGILLGLFRIDLA